MKSRIIAIGLCAFGCVVIGAVIYAQVANTNSPSLQAVEVNAQVDNAKFASADQNGDGALSKEEFANYFAKIQQVKLADNNSANETPKGGCCGGKNKAKDAVVKNNEKSSCCGGGKNAETVNVKFSKEGEPKSGGCCGGKNKVKDAVVKNNEKSSCCGGGKNVETVKVDSSKETKTEIKVTPTTKNEVKTDTESKAKNAGETESNNKQ
ncbi:MAG: hypothetical protein LBP59_00570 [Planctomycetaceae bacterium]|jgi:hypothetical protein|nr:hypothetical protein [Planctomycetaceae bacterium]